MQFSVNTFYPNQDKWNVIEDDIQWPALEKFIYFYIIAQSGK